MPPTHPTLPPPPQPTRQLFDPFNSSSTGHQRADSRLSGSTSWRASRSYKLSHQLRDTSGRGGTQHLSDLVGAGSENFGIDGRKENGDWEPNAPGLREDGWRDIRSMMQGTRKRGRVGGDSSDKTNDNKRIKRDDGVSAVTGDGLQYWQGKLSTDKTLVSTSPYNPQLRVRAPESTSTPTTTQSSTSSLHPTPDTLSTTTGIFAGLNIFLNGSTAPLISDHKLKQQLAQHGANVSIALGRRSVTHVILGERGGLAASKVQKEVARVGGKGVKFVGVRWVLDSIARGKRQSENRYQVAHLAMKGQKSVLAVFGGKKGGTALSKSQTDG